MCIISWSMNGTGCSNSTTSVAGSFAVTPSAFPGILPVLTACAFLTAYNIGVAGGGFRIENPAPRVDEIICGHRLTVGPDVVAQVKGPDLAVFRAAPALGGARNDISSHVFGGQTDEQIADDIGRIGLLRVVW